MSRGVLRRVKSGSGFPFGFGNVRDPVRIPCEDEEEIGEAVEIHGDLLADIFVSRKADDDPLRPAADRTRKVQAGGDRRSSRQNERAERFELWLELMFLFRERGVARSAPRWNRRL
jgi:hypothetical protein